MNNIRTNDAYNNNWKNESMDLNIFYGNEVNQMLQFNSNSNISVNDNDNNINNKSIVLIRQNKIGGIIIGNLSK